VQELQVSEAEDLRALCSDKPGSIFVANSRGVHHLIAEDQQRGEQFRLHETYAFPPATVIQTQFTCPYSDLAGLIIDSPGRQLRFVSMP